MVHVFAIISKATPHVVKIFLLTYYILYANKYYLKTVVADGIAQEVCRINIAY